MFIIDKIFNLKIDTKNKNITTVTGLKQYDNNSVLNVTLLQNSLALDLSNCTVRINFKREDNKVLLYMANIANAREGKVSVKLSPEVLKCTGNIETDISVFDSNLLKITSATFILKVDKAIYNNDTYFTDKDLDLMQQEYVRENERQDNENTRKINENNRVQTETKREQNENTRISNEEARKKAEDTRVSEWNNVKKDANNIKNTLDTTIDTANKTDTDLKNNIDTADKLKQELTPQNYVKNTDYQEYKKQVDDTLKDNTTKTITENKSIIDISDNVPGITNITLEGNTVDICKEPIVSDFYGKTPGDNLKNPNSSRFSFVSTEILQPSSFKSEAQGTFDYNLICTLNGECGWIGTDNSSSNPAVKDVIPQQLFSFNIIAIVEKKIGTIPGSNASEKVAWLKKNITKITCNWWGYGSCPGGNKAYLAFYRTDINKWSSTPKSNISSSPTLISDYIMYPNVTNYIDTTGFTHFLAYTDASDGNTPSTIYTDYVNIEVQLNPILKSVGEEENNKIEVKSIGKNLFNGVYSNKFTSGGYPYDINATSDTRTAFIKIQPGKTYYVKKYNKSSRLILGLYNYINVGSTPLKPLKDCGDNSMECSITNDVNAKYLSIYVSNISEKPKMQVEEGTQATEYEDYKEDKATITLKEPLRGLPNGVRDTINTDGTITRRVGKVVLNENSLFFMRESTDGGWKQFEDSLIFEDDGFEQRYKLKHFSSILSNMSVKEIVNNNVEGIAYNAGTGWSYFAIRIKKSKLSTPDINGFKKYLKENPLTVYYELKEPIIESIGQPLTLQSYLNGTLQVDTEITPYLTVKYPSNLNSRISTVEEANTNIKNNLGGAWQTLLILADKELKMKSISKLTTTDDVSKKINEIIGVW